MTEEDKYIKTYSIGLMILAFLDQYSLLRFGVYAKTYNTIFAKHEIFLNQIRALKKGKKKALSDKCLLFRRACFITEKAWTDGMRLTVGMHYTPEAVVFRLCYEYLDMLLKVYGVSSDDIKSISRNISLATESSQNIGLQWSSYKVARSLLEKLQEHQNSEPSNKAGKTNADQ